MYNVYHIQLIKVNTNEGNYSLIISMNIAAFIKEIPLLLQSIWHFFCWLQLKYHSFTLPTSLVSNAEIWKGMQ